ncbi:hypothetical protein ACF1GY_09245 [Streptomyces sp. NPDC014684]|uniref:hypothetical protein n=1 Tax=unclassified Streptomyces TaxID=2593676 RepID=UPI0033F866E8
MLSGIRPSRGGHRALGVALIVAALAVTGCSPLGGEPEPARKQHASKTARAGSGPARTPRPRVSAAPAPRTAAQFVARARRAMKGERGWTFALRGSESAVMRGQAPSSATYSATVHRTTDPEALEQTGAVTTGKGERKSEVVYVVGGTGYVKDGAGAWKKGPLSDPGIANDVEDPLAELDAFEAYAGSAKVSRRTEADGGLVRLQVGASGWPLSAARGRPALKRAVREVEPTLAQLRKAGVTATDGRITLKSFTETWDLDAAHGYRLASHRYAFTFLVPFQGGDITVSQEVRADSRGVFTGRVTLPADAT